jgi:dCTP deaminase
MAVLSDTQIAERCGWTNLAVNNAMQSGTFKTVDSPMIEPFYPSQVRTKRLRSLATDEWDVEKIVSFGLSSYGYDARIDKTFKVFTSPYGNISDLSDVVLDPKHFDDKHYQEVMAAEDGRLIIPPNGFVLGHTVEYFRIPRDILVVCLGKSTYARLGLVVNVTPLEPEWEGQVVIEISNTTNRPVAIHAGEGIAQFLFMKGDAPCLLSYKDRAGKYQGQTGVQTAKV